MNTSDYGNIKFTRKHILSKSQDFFVLVSDEVLEMLRNKEFSNVRYNDNRHPINIQEFVGTMETYPPYRAFQIFNDDKKYNEKKQLHKLQQTIRKTFLFGEEQNWFDAFRNITYLLENLRKDHII